MVKNDTLGAEFFSSNRQRLRDSFGGTASIVITGNSYQQKSADISYSFSQDSSFWYLTGIDEPGTILVMEPSKTYLIIADRDEIRIAFEGNVDRDEMTKLSGVDEVYGWEEGWERLSKRVKKSKHIATLQPSPSYIEHFDMFTNPSRARLVGLLQQHNSELDLIDLAPFIKALRMVKTPGEIDLIRRAVQETISLLVLIDKKRPTAKSANNLLAYVTKQVIDRKLEFAFDTIISSGKNTATIHYIKNDDSLKKNELMLVDIGVRYNGYCADISRTVVDEPTPRHQQVFDAVLAVQSFAMSLLKPGIDLNTYEEAVANYMGEKLRELGLIKTISKNSIREYFPTRTSHFIGIDAHDAGDYDRLLEPGAVLAVEPGIYIQEEGIGIRLEDNVLITETGSENLSEQLPKTLTSLTISPQ